MPDNSTIVTGSGNAWTKDMAGLLLSAPSEGSAPAVLFGFADLDGGQTPPSDTPNKYIGCNVVHPTMSVGPPTCSGGLKQVASWPFCGRFNHYFPTHSVYPSDVGSVILLDQYITTWHRQCTSDGRFDIVLNGFWSCGRSSDIQDDILVLVDDLQITDSNCLNNQTGTYRSPSNTCIADKSDPQGTYCELHTPNPIIDAQQTNAIDILCCAEK